ncbi:MAG: hypothetical protein Q9224_006681, partial [Gallowayella concinna]
GTWLKFLHEDADITRNALKRWWIEYLKSQEGKALPKAVKTEMKGLLEATLPNAVSRHTLQLGTVSVIERWEAIPMVQGSAEWTKARIRLVRDLIINALFPMYQVEFDLKATTTEISLTRCWIFLNSSGLWDNYRSLAQPWSYKDIEWSNEGPITRLADPTTMLTALPATLIDATMDLNRLRISKEDFSNFILFLYEGMAKP